MLRILSLYLLLQFDLICAVGVVAPLAGLDLIEHLLLELLAGDEVIRLVLAPSFPLLAVPDKFRLERRRHPSIVCFLGLVATQTGKNGVLAIKARLEHLIRLIRALYIFDFLLV